jgi:hypothetical protein
MAVDALSLQAQAVSGFSLGEAEAICANLGTLGRADQRSRRVEKEVQHNATLVGVTEGWDVSGTLNLHQYLLHTLWHSTPTYS